MCLTMYIKNNICHGFSNGLTISLLVAYLGNANLPLAEQKVDVMCLDFGEA